MGLFDKFNDTNAGPPHTKVVKLGVADKSKLVSLLYWHFSTVKLGVADKSRFSNALLAQSREVKFGQLDRSSVMIPQIALLPQ
ncbi:hypothetical protein CLI82_02370 [Porphyromonas gingivalis]|nr:hypothetical protein CLI82_02370 [Porphyromonas gingivalis]